MTETVPDDWANTSATCEDPTNNSTVGNINVGVGETITCTFENTKDGKIVIDKKTDPSGDDTSFPFTLTGGPAGSTVNKSFDLTDAATPEETAVKPGSGYNAEETTPLPAGWDLTDATCDKGETNLANITVEPGETVTCTFENTKGGHILIDKVTDPSGDPKSSTSRSPADPTP